MTAQADELARSVRDVERGARAVQEGEQKYDAHGNGRAIGRAHAFCVLVVLAVHVGVVAGTGRSNRRWGVMGGGGEGGGGGMG